MVNKAFLYRIKNKHVSVQHGNMDCESGVYREMAMNDILSHGGSLADYIAVIMDDSDLGKIDMSKQEDFSLYLVINYGEKRYHKVIDTKLDDMGLDWETRGPFKGFG